MQYKNNFFLYILLMHCFSLFSHEFPQVPNNVPHVKVNIDSPKVQQSNTFDVSWNVIVQQNPSSYQFRANHSVIAHNASQPLKLYFNDVIAPMFRATMIKDHRCAIPGYQAPYGLRDCINQLSYFSQSDSLILKDL